MSLAADKIIDQAADYYFNKLASNLIHQLKRAPQEYRQSPDSGLNNLWEEICVQKQQDDWDGWSFVEKHITAQCYLKFDEQPDVVKAILSFEFLVDDDIVIHEDDVCEKLLNEILQIAMSFHNRRIEKYLFD